MFKILVLITMKWIIMLFWLQIIRHCDQIDRFKNLWNSKLTSLLEFFGSRIYYLDVLGLCDWEKL